MSEAWTGPDRIGKWWGPGGFTTTQNINLREGVSWSFIMHGPDSTDYSNRIVYTDKEWNEYPKYDHFGHEDGEDDPPHIKSTVTFESEEGKTRVTLRILFPTKEDPDKTLEFGAFEGGKPDPNTA